MIIGAVIIIINQVTTSEAESNPSLNTAKLPDISPMIIFANDNSALPTTLTHEVTSNVFFLSTFFDFERRKIT